MTKKTVNFDKNAWVRIAMSIETKIRELSALPEPLASREIAPFAEDHAKVMELVTDTNTPKSSS